MLSWLNRIAGGLFAVVLYLFVLSIVVNVFDYFDKGSLLFIGKSSTSRFYGPLSDFAPAVLPFIHFEDWNTKKTETLQQSTTVPQSI